MRNDLSSVLLTGNNLWVSCDERTTIERLRRTGPHAFSEYHSYQLTDFLDLPANETVEIDIEGLAEANYCLWLMGSHGLKRKQSDGNDIDTNKQIAKLAKTKADPNHSLLARMPLLRNAATSEYELRKKNPRTTDPN